MLFKYPLRLVSTLALFAALASVASAYVDLTAPPMSKAELILILQTHPEVTELDQVPALLPSDFLMNFTLKHGIKRQGERGHLVETKVSQSADPDAPRAIIFDERTGFTVSYNGGTQGQLAGNRLDTLSFDPKAKTFNLEAIDFPIQPGHPVFATTDCGTCHGPALRPIFAMYPDWPSFYGSDNDELTGATENEKAELANYLSFRQDAGLKSPRYSPLFEDKQVEERLDVPMYESFPYRPDVSETPTSISRSFAFRPSLRQGIVYNRLMAKNIFNRIKAHTNYSGFGEYALFNIVECTPSSPALQTKWLPRVKAVLRTQPILRSSGRLDYDQLLALFGLRINDVDIRYSYNHPGFANKNAKGKIMEVGYIDSYYNSYFDGSTTMNELLSAELYTDIKAKNPNLQGKATPRGLTEKYRHFAARFKFDQDFFESVDGLGKWIPIKYAYDVAGPQHREVYTSEMSKEHAILCHVLESNLTR